MTEQHDRRSRLLDAWLHSDLVGIPLTLAVAAIVAVSAALYLVLGDVAGLVVGKTLFIAALAGLFGLILLLNGRRGETMDGISPAPAGARRRVLVVANEGLQSDALGDTVLGTGGDGAVEAMLVVPVVASSPLHLLADDVDAELEAADARLGTAVDRLRRVGVATSGHVDIASPQRCLADGLREFAATEVVMLPGSERGWRDAERFGERVERELGLPVVEVPPGVAAR